MNFENCAQSIITNTCTNSSTKTTKHSTFFHYILQQNQDKNPDFLQDFIPREYNCFRDRALFKKLDALAEKNIADEKQAAIERAAAE